MIDLLKITEECKKRNKMRSVMFKKIFQILMIISVLGCNNKIGASNDLKIYNINEIPEEAVEQINKSFIYSIKFSNLIYNIDGKKIVVPVFQGTLNSVDYVDFKNYCRQKQMLALNARESGFFTKAKKGEIKKTFLEFMKFYQSNLLKGYETPVIVDNDGDEWLIVYKFKVDQIPCTMKIFVSADKNDRSSLKKNIKMKDISVNEKKDNPGFVYEIYINYDE